MLVRLYAELQLEVGEKTVKDNNKVKKKIKKRQNKNLKMQSFGAVFNYSNRATRKKNKSNYPFISIVKNNCK